MGKWHLGRRGSSPQYFLDPILHGWDLFIGTESNLANYEGFVQWLGYPWSSTRVAPETYSTTELTNHAARLIQELPEPWFLTVSYHAVHLPLHVPPLELHHQGNPATPLGQYRAMVQAMDTELGRLWSRLDFGGTTVIVVGDNGSMNSLIGSSGKGSHFEPGINVPMIVAGRAIPTAQRGAVTDAMCHTTDLFATIADLAGAPHSAEDAVSLVPVLHDPQRQVRDVVFTDLFKPNNTSVVRTHTRAARAERYKVIENVSLGEAKLYDLATAPPGRDGAPLAPGSLTPEELAIFNRLLGLLQGRSP